MAVHWTAYGRPAATLLHAKVAQAKEADPLRPVTVVVPTNFVGVSMRRLLAGGAYGPVTGAGKGIAGVSLLTVYRLAELLGAPRLAAAGRRPVSTPVIAAAVRAALTDDPGHFEPVAGHPSTERALVEAHRELADLSAGALETLAAAGPRAGDVVRLHRDVRSRLAAGWYDEGALMGAATGAARARSPLVADLGVVVVYLPQNLSSPAAGLLRTLAATTTVEVVAGHTGVDAADRDVHRSLQRLGVIERPSEPAPAVTATAVVSTSDADEEVRAAVRRVTAAMHDGVPLERMAVLYPHAEPYAQLVHEHLRAAGIPYNGAAVRGLSQRVAGRWLLDALRLPDRGFRRQDVLDLLASAPVLIGKGRAVPVAAWERASRTAGVVRGRAGWDRRIDASRRRLLTDAQRLDEAVAADEDVPAWRPDALRRQARDAAGLRGFVLELIGRLEDGAGLGSWSELAAWARALLERYLGDEAARARWDDDEEIRAAGKVERALDRLAVLDAVERQASLPTFRRTLELELDSDLDRVGRLGHGLLAGTLAAGLGVDLDVVIVLGCAEGTLPDRVREDSLLPDTERAAVSAELQPRADRVHVAHRYLLAALAAAERERVLCYPRGDLRRSVERPPSRWLVEATATLPGADGPSGALPAQAAWLEYRPSFAATVSVAEPATRLELHLRMLADGRARGHRLDHEPLVTGDLALSRGLRLVRARESDEFTRFDGNLAGLAGLVPAPTAGGQVTSPTRLETWARCPLRYLLERVLRVELVDNPEELLEISPMDRGTLVHEVLELWLAARIEQGVPEPDEPWPPDARAALRAVGEEVCDRYEAQGLVGHPLLWSRDRERILLDLGRFLTADDGRRRELGLRPVAAEVPFGLDGHPPVEVVLGDGRTVRFRGKVDRLDAAEGRLVVTDYKTGGSWGMRDLSADDPVLGGTKLQLPVYGLAARARSGDASAPVSAEYWFVTTRHAFARHGYVVSDEVLAALRDTVGTIVAGIEGGHFPARPAEPGWRPWVECDYCDPDGLGTADRWRLWRRKRLAPELRDYVRLVEPEALEALEAGVRP